jgi:hypothetical protein
MNWWIGDGKLEACCHEFASCKFGQGMTLSFTVKLGSVIEVALMGRDGCRDEFKAGETRVPRLGVGDLEIWSWARCCLE